MKIFAAQFSPALNDFERNLNKHIELIELAIKQNADLVFFSELSLTGYDRQLASQFSSSIFDKRFDCFQRLSDEFSIIIAVGMPLKDADEQTIGMIFFQPNKERQSYSKQMLHSSEMPYFKKGCEQLYLHESSEVIAPAICYESLQAKHLASVLQNGMTVYLASVAKDEDGYQRGIKHYAQLAKQSNVVVLMANSFGACDGFESCGLSSVWNKQGECVATLGSNDEGLVGIDLCTNDAVVIKHTQ